MNGQADNYIFPFLWMHGEDEMVLRTYVNVIYHCGIRAFCVESRPHPDFCGDGWWHDMDIILDQAKKLIYIIIYSFLSKYPFCGYENHFLPFYF